MTTCLEHRSESFAQNAVVVTQDNSHLRPFPPSRVQEAAMDPPASRRGCRRGLGRLRDRSETWGQGVRIPQLYWFVTARFLMISGENCGRDRPPRIFGESDPISPQYALLSRCVHP
jgi:hypothetical protein